VEELVRPCSWHRAVGRMANRALRRARQKEHETAPWRRRLQSAVVCTGSTGKAGAESRKVVDLTPLCWEEGLFAGSFGERQANVRQHPKAVKRVEETIGGKLIFSYLEALKREQWEAEKSGGDSRQDPGLCSQAVSNLGINRIKTTLRGVRLCLSC